MIDKESKQGAVATAFGAVVGGGGALGVAKMGAIGIAAGGGAFGVPAVAVVAVPAVAGAAVGYCAYRIGRRIYNTKKQRS